MTQLKAVSLVCTLTSSPGESSSEQFSEEIEQELEKYDVETTRFRVVDYKVRFGVEKDMGEGDEWPVIRREILDADILLICTPIWMGQLSSVAKMALERLGAELSETDEQGRPLLYGKVAIAGIVGNEDGAHHVSAALYQALSDTGFTIPAGGPAYWVGEAMGSVDYKDLDKTPDKTQQTMQTNAKNAAHLAKLLKQENYPA
jgi:multimeric flavodoxin WrbA